jgi:hypothetical protein
MEEHNKGGGEISPTRALPSVSFASADKKSPSEGPPGLQVTINIADWGESRPGRWMATFQSQTHGIRSVANGFGRCAACL